MEISSVFGGALDGTGRTRQCRRMIRTLLSLSALAACAPSAGHSTIAEPQIVGSITYSTSACFGPCPVYSVEIDTWGKAIFTGKKFTAATGVHRFPYRTEEYQAFRTALEPARPSGPFTGGQSPTLERKIIPGAPDCGYLATDLPTIVVIWREGSNPIRETRLTAYLGCDDLTNNRALFAVLRTAPNVLPIQDLIGKR